ncbi:alpha-amylase family glycosyl hydrolase [Atopobacter phocae]|uniref:alpha-amylase family glycosyl hydrolase n=1 Tax=Atopobacter phocae TaxID=136492 RepID=UPI001FE0098B|nr:alpha-amylase family glycosyl hydrolase [Atopobacter phocae]
MEEFQVEKTVQRYSIRRLKTGVGSVLLFTGLFFAPSINHSTILADSVKESGTTERLEILNDKEQPVALNAQETSAVASDLSEEDTKVTASDSKKEETLTEEKKFKTGDVSETTTPTQVQNVEKEAPAVQNGNFRIHFKGIKTTNEDKYSVWVWGGVEKISQDVAPWPDGATPIESDHTTAYGSYVDIKQSAVPSDINYILLKNGKKVEEGNKAIHLRDQSQKEAWVEPDFAQRDYKPLEENVLRINYKRTDGDYKGWSVWLWGDAQKHSDSNKGVTDAIEFKEEGSFGRYIDVPLSKGIESNLKFLLVNKEKSNDKWYQSRDLSVLRKNSGGQIFLKDEDFIIFKDPFYNHGEANPDAPISLNVTASVNRAIHYDQSAVLSIQATGEEKAQITGIKADISAVGGPSVQLISPILKKVSFSVNHNVKPGKYKIPVTVMDSKYREYHLTTEVEVVERNKKPGTFDWDERVIYFMVTDRFNDGNKENNNPNHLPYAEAKNQRGVYRGGDFKGITEKLDYLSDLGVNTIWVTPIVQNVEHNPSYGTKNGAYYGYHGYWASDFEKLNPHLGTLKEFHELIDKAAEKGIQIMVDVVLNHAGYGMDGKGNRNAPGFPTEAERKRFEGMLRQNAADNVDSDPIHSTLAGLPDFKTEDHNVRKQLVDWQKQWLKTAKTEKGNSIYAYRVDTVKHVDPETWQHFKNELVQIDPGFHLIGESWDAEYRDTKGHLGYGMMDSLLDFGFKNIAKQLINGQLQEAHDELIKRNQKLTSNETLGQFLSSHDEDGFIYKNLAHKKDLALIAATLQMMSKGQPVIYYGEELGQSGANNWPEYGNRYDLDWNKVETSPVLRHYKKLLQFRKDHSELLARGTLEVVGGSDAERWLLSKRSQGKKAVKPTVQMRSANTTTNDVYIGYNLSSAPMHLTLKTTPNAIVTDHYSNQTYQSNDAGEVQLMMPTIKEGGTVLLSVDRGIIQEAKSVVTTPDNLKDGHVRIYYNGPTATDDQSPLPSTSSQNLGAWVWFDAEHAKTDNDKDKWPMEAQAFSGVDDIGHYVDVPLATNAKKIGFQIVDRVNKKKTADYVFTQLDTNRVIYIDAGNNTMYVRPGALPSDEFTPLKQEKPKTVPMKPLVPGKPIKQQPNDQTSEGKETNPIKPSAPGKQNEEPNTKPNTKLNGETPKETVPMTPLVPGIQTEKQDAQDQLKGTDETIKPDNKPSKDAQTPNVEPSTDTKALNKETLKPLVEKAKEEQQALKKATDQLAQTLAIQSAKEISKQVQLTTQSALPQTGEATVYQTAALMALVGLGLAPMTMKKTEENN